MSGIPMRQNHLDHKDTVNFGSYYTPPEIVDMVYSLIEKNVPDFGAYYILDTSCGYGAFLRGGKTIGADIDKTAVETAKTKTPGAFYVNHNSLEGISRSRYSLNESDKIIVVGNPPYNDTTSIIRNKIKQNEFSRDADVAARDAGISFLLSYNKLAADFVCVLHPLSYLIKKANFEALKSFRKNYTLIDSWLISSGVFSATSKTTFFPVIIALYERSRIGMEYEYIKNYKFKTSDNKIFSIHDYDTIGNYISKYPNHKQVDSRETAAYFYTLRDINALKRAATFLPKETANAIRVTKETLPYYCYVDVFKEYIPHIPYYFGNCDIMIDNGAFEDLKPVFVSRSAQKHPGLFAYTNIKNYGGAAAPAPLTAQTAAQTAARITDYFKRLLGEHYVE
jgi:hypothetical protein